MPESADVAVASRSAIADFDVRFAAARERLLRIAGSLVGVDEAEDVVQDTYVAARRRLPQLRDPDALEAWLTSIAVNLAFSRHRRRRRLRDLLPVLHRSQAGRRPRDPALRELVEALPPRERTVLVLHYGHGYRLEEVAALLDLTHTNVRTIIARTRKRLFTAWRETDGSTMARFWAPQGSAAGITVLDGEAAIVTGPDAPEVARQRARNGRLCRTLLGARTESDVEALPSMDRVFGALNAEHGVNPFTSKIAYLGPTELVVETHTPSYAADREGPLEYIGVVRRDASGWRLAGVKSTDHIDGAAGIGLVRLDALDGAARAYAAVYGVPATLAPVAVDIIVAGVAYRYAIAEDGFLAVVPAEVGQAVTYGYRDADGTVVEEGVVPE